MGKLKSVIVGLYQRFRNFILYGIIGGTSAGLDFLTYTILCYCTLGHQLANVISTHIGIFCSFILNKKYNFKTSDRTFKRFVSFYLVGLFGLGLTWLILHIMVDRNGMDKLIAKLVAIIVVALIQFFLNKFITFNKKKYE